VSGGRVPRALRDRLVAQAGHRCSYCRSSEQITGIELELDHLWPEALGGTSDEVNLAPSCGPCNDHKQARVLAEDPVTGQTVALFHPRTQRWAEHFAWEEGGLRMRGLTPSGRATERALHLNRPALVGARRYWIAAGWHPPADDA
jgi:hypothetical protein